MANQIKILLSFILAVFASFLHQYGLIIILVGIAICLDFLTGIVKSKIKQNISSKIGYVGFFKKIALMLSLFFAIFFDFFTPLLISFYSDLSLPFALPFGIFTGSYIILNECISICENLFECNVPMPKFFIKTLKLAKSYYDEQ